MRTAVFDLKDGYDSDAAKKASNYKPRIGLNSSSCNSNHKTKNQKNCVGYIGQSCPSVWTFSSILVSTQVRQSINQSHVCRGWGKGAGTLGGGGGGGDRERHIQSQRIFYMLHNVMLCNRQRRSSSKISILCLPSRLVRDRFLILHRLSRTHLVRDLFLMLHRLTGTLGQRLLSYAAPSNWNIWPEIAFLCCTV